MDPSDIIAMLRVNQDKEFVRRVLEPALYPRQQNPGGSHSTHKMASAEVGGRPIAFPTLFHEPQSNTLYQPVDPVREAMRRGEYMEFRTPQQAEEFARQYKAGMGAGRSLLSPDIFNAMWR